MGKAKRNIEVSLELGWTDEQTARALGISPSKFAELSEQLKAWGFPERHPLTGRFVVDQVRAWYNAPLRGAPQAVSRPAEDDSGPHAPAPATLPPKGVSNIIAERLRNNGTR